jgi:hypothetical protein
LKIIKILIFLFKNLKILFLWNDKSPSRVILIKDKKDKKDKNAA